MGGVQAPRVACGGGRAHEGEPNMLKMGGRGDVDGKPVELMIIGLSHKNLDELRKGHPIKCRASDFGVTGDIEILIFSGPTEMAMAREMADLVGPETDTKIDPRLRD